MNLKTNVLCWLFLAIVFFAGGLFSQQETVGITTKTYSAVNPYAEVKWESYGHYKTNLHTHTTTQSDGSLTPDNLRSQ